MLATRTIRRTLAAILTCTAGAAMARAQASSLPAMAPTNTVAPLNATAAVSDTTTRAHRAEVRYDDGLLSVNANNSGLNAILRQIAALTGMRITGGVRDERVFGHYGPAAPGEIIDTLLDGTGTNVLLRQTDGDAPLELVLTPRNGGPTPPNPNAPGFDDPPEDAAPAPAQTNSGLPIAQPRYSLPTADNPGRNISPVATVPAPNASVPASIPQPANNVLGDPNNVTPTASQIPNVNSQSLDTVATPSTATPPPQGIVDSTNPVPAGTMNPAPVAPGEVTTPVSPTQGVSPAASDQAPPETTPTSTQPATATPPKPATAEEYFQQLQKLRQQNPAPAPQ